MSKYFVSELLTFLFLIFVVIYEGKSQNIQVEVNHQPLNKVLYNLGSTHNIQLSFNDGLVSKCLVTNSDSYGSIDEALNSLLSYCGYNYRVVNNVYVIYKEEIKRKIQSKPLYLFKGQIINKFNSEPLPFFLC